SHFHETAAKQQALAEVIAAIGVARFVRFFGNIKSRLCPGRSHQFDSLMIKTVKANRRIFRSLLMNARQAIERLAQLLARGGAPFTDVRRKHDVADFEIFVVGTAADDERSMLR